MLALLGCQSKPTPSAEADIVAVPKSLKTFRDKVDTAMVAVLPYDHERDKYRLKNAQASGLNLEEIGLVDSLLQVCIAEHNRLQSIELRGMRQARPDIPWDSTQFLITLPNYRRQLVPYLNAKGEKEVWVNCFCDKTPYWRKDIVDVDDGGNCFFNLKINLRRRSWFDLMVNGVA
ncbi:hypothetical protein B0919_05110 [Hymenobacter sp. CRA2]|nr:hypothetical protein B0919_05110 [Hymenobacter sp. CRA2]